MRAQDAIRSFFEQHLVARIFLRNATRGVPGGSHFTFYLVLQALFAGLAFSESHRSERRDRKDHCRNTEIVRLLVIPLQQISRDDDALVACNRSQGRPSAASPLPPSTTPRFSYPLQY